MALSNTLEGAYVGAGLGLDLYKKFMDTAASTNEQVANANYLLAQQNAKPPAGINVPGAAVSLVSAPGLTYGAPATPAPAQVLAAPPRMDSIGPGLGSYEQFAQQWGLPAASAAPAASPTPASAPTAQQPWMPMLPALTGGPFPNSPVGNVENFVNNSMPNLARGVWNLASIPVNAAQWLFTPQNPASPAAPAATSPSQTPAASLPAGSSPSSAPGGLSAPAVSTPTAGATLSGDSAGVSDTTSQDAGIPKDIRDHALSVPPETHQYMQERLLAQRQQITDDANKAIAFINSQRQQIAAVTQQHIARLQQDAQIAQQTGNIGKMKSLLDQVDTIYAGALPTLQQLDTQAQQVSTQADQAYRQNEDNLWMQQAMQAESEFVNAGDPSRMIQMFGAYGLPVQLQDAGNGKYYVISATGNGQGKRWGSGDKADAYTPAQISDIFHALISDEFRQQQATTQAATTAKLLDAQLELQKIDAQSRADITKALAEKAVDLQQYNVQSDSNTGDIYLIPKGGPGSGTMYKIAANPDEIPGSGGVKRPVLQELN